MKLSKTNDQSNFTSDMVIALKYSLIPIKSRIILQLSELSLRTEPNCAAVLRPSQVTQNVSWSILLPVLGHRKVGHCPCGSRHLQITLPPQQTGRLSSFSPLPASSGRPEGCAHFRTCFICNLMMLTLKKVTITTDGKINAHIQGQNLAEVVLVPSEITNRIRFTAWILVPFIKSGKIISSKQSNFSWNKNLSWLKIIEGFCPWYCLWIYWLVWHQPEKWFQKWRQKYRRCNPRSRGRRMSSLLQGPWQALAKILLFNCLLWHILTSERQDLQHFLFHDINYVSTSPSYSSWIMRECCL